MNLKRKGKMLAMWLSFEGNVVCLARCSFYVLVSVFVVISLLEKKRKLRKIEKRRKNRRIYLCNYNPDVKRVQCYFERDSKEKESGVVCALLVWKIRKSETTRDSKRIIYSESDLLLVLFKCIPLLGCEIKDLFLLCFSLLVFFFSSSSLFRIKHCSNFNENVS